VEAAVSGFPFWHVTLTLAGDPVPEQEIRAALEHLSHDHPFLLSGRYGVDRAEVRYWEESPDVRTVSDLALTLWDTHREACNLPDWEVVGLEVVDRATFHKRGRVATPVVAPVSLVGVAPF
jgi:hypothetical protein